MMKVIRNTIRKARIRRAERELAEARRQAATHQAHAEHYRMNVVPTLSLKLMILRTQKEGQ